MNASRFSLRMLSILGATLFLGVATVYASATTGTIDSAYKYAWSNVGGYVNMAPSQGGLTITDSGIAGYAWSANGGYINFDTNLSSVTNDGEGNLGGFAWGAGAGWISFSGVTIDSNGKFHGSATGGTVNGASYAITFDCANCDVRTDWRPVSARDEDTPADSGSSGGSSGQRVTTPPTDELPGEPTMPPPSIPGEPGAGPDGSGEGSEGTGITPGGTPTGEPSSTSGMTDTNGDGVIDENDMQVQDSMAPVAIVVGTIFGLLALFFLVWFFAVRRRNP